jgi:hypothetical protein
MSFNRAGRDWSAAVSTIGPSQAFREGVLRRPSMLGNVAMEIKGKTSQEYCQGCVVTCCDNDDDD